MRYHIRYSRTATKSIERLRRGNPQVARRIIETIIAMQEEPLRGDVKPLKARDGYRRRVGDWRIIFDVEDGIVHIEKIGHRRDIYSR